MRQIRTAQRSIFEIYAEHEIAYQLKQLSSVLDAAPELLDLIGKDLIDQSLKDTGRCGLTVETVFRCLVLKQKLKISYEQLAFHLCDSMSYRTFARLQEGVTPGKSSLQSTIRNISPETLEKVNQLIMNQWLDNSDISCKKLRTDSTVVKSNIASPSDSQLLNDGIRVLSRLLAKSHESTGIKIRFTDQRKASKSLAFRIFTAKKAEKEALYPDLLKNTGTVLQQVENALLKVEREGNNGNKTQQWRTLITHYRDLTKKVVEQTRRRVIEGETVPSSDKIVSLFEEHTDIIVKGFRDVQYGHKINVSSEDKGFITHVSIEDGNPADSTLFLPVLTSHQTHFKRLPESVVSDGCYASQENALKAREMGVTHVVFSKPVGLSYHQMGVKKKTFQKLKNFRAGVEGNISELKRVFGATRATWKGLDGFKAFVWSSVLSYNLVRMARQQLE